MTSDFVIDRLGLVHSRANWDALRKFLPRGWLAILGPGHPISPHGFFQVIPDASMPPNSFELRSGSQRLRVRWVDEDAELDRWTDDGGSVP